MVLVPVAVPIGGWKSRMFGLVKLTIELEPTNDTVQLSDSGSVTAGKVKIKVFPVETFGPTIVVTKDGAAFMPTVMSSG